MGEMSKVEEVARAMFKELSKQHPELPESGAGFGYAEAGYQSIDEGLTILDGAYDLKAVARAAIEEMRKQTVEMIDAADCLLGSGWDDQYHAFIDAALKE